jgi:hypothetical protein
MPTEKRSRLLETLAGTGIVYEGERRLASVRFSLTVTREINLPGSSSGRPPLRDIRGIVTILSGERHLRSGSTLVLRLADGRQWEFVVQNGNFISGEYVAVGTGRQDIIPG